MGGSLNEYKVFYKQIDAPEDQRAESDSDLCDAWLTFTMLQKGMPGDK